MRDVFVSHMVIAAGETADGARLADAIRGFIGPLVLLFISIVALSFLMQRQITQFFQFIVLAVGVGVFFYTPTVLEKFANVISNAI